MVKLEGKLPIGKPKTHGGYSFLAGKSLPETRRHILVYLTNTREGLIEDIAGSEAKLTAAQGVIIDRIISKLGICRCIEEHTRENSVMVGQNLAPALQKSYLAYNNSIRLDLISLGMEKREGPELDPIQYLQEGGQG